MRARFPPTVLNLKRSKNSVMWNAKAFSSATVRLTIVYTVIWCCVLTGLLFACRTTLVKSERASTSKLLAADWDTMKGYLRIESGKAMWYADFDDPDEKATVSRLMKAFLMVDSNGGVIERSTAAASLERSLPKTFVSAFRVVQRTRAPFSTMIRDEGGRPFLLLCGPLRDEPRSHNYYAFIGRPIVANESLVFRFFNNWQVLLLVAVSLSGLLSAMMVRHCSAVLSRPSE
jgi:hypothetical protein